jgi:hypothetical protein
MHDDIPRIKLDDLIADYPGVFESAKHVGVGIGWLPLVRSFLAEAVPHDPSLAVFEMKEKWGVLRICTDTDVLPARLAKAKAEIKSAFLCEVCGADGYIRRPPPDGGWAWWRCVCDEHASPDQRSWPRVERRTDSMMQVSGHWYRYEKDTDAMVPCEPTETRSR